MQFLTGYYKVPAQQQALPVCGKLPQPFTMTRKMKFYILLIVMINLLACKHTPKNAAEKIELEDFVNKTLLRKIESLVRRQDSLADSNRINSRHRSFWTYFYQKGKDCYVAVMSNFEYYSSKNTNGYINYRDKIL